MVVDRVASASWSAGPIALSASAGQRTAPDEHTGFGSVTAGLDLGRAVALQGSAGSYPSSRLLGTPGGRYASLGFVVRHTSGTLESGEETVAVRGAPPVPAGATRLVLRAPHAHRVEVAGDWNGWTPTAAVRGEDGRWYADVRVAPGEYRYAFRIDGEQWTVPGGASAVNDGYGGRSALLTVH
jgi:hypothetical protein